MIKQRLFNVRPLSPADIALSSLMVIGVIAIWFSGDFHAQHHSDSILYSLISLYRWTYFAWDWDHSGTLPSLLVSFIRRPYLNLAALNAVSSFLFLSGYALWGRLVSHRETTLVANTLWAVLIIPLIYSRYALFQNASQALAIGVALSFAGLFASILVSHARAGLRFSSGRSLLLIVAGFIAIYMEKNVLVPMSFVTAGMIAESAMGHFSANSNEQRISFGNVARHLWPLACLALALLIYQILEWNAPVHHDFSLRLADVPNASARLFRNWSQEEVTTPLWLALPAALLLYQAMGGHRRNPVFTYLAAGVAVELFVVAGLRWIALSRYSGRFFSDLTFIAVVAAVWLLNQISRRLPSASRPVAIAVAAAIAIYINVREWNSIPPRWPLAVLENTLGASTQAFADANCDVLVGDYWRVWPAVLAVNDYYYREGIRDPVTGDIRVVPGITTHGWSTESLWRPRLDWPGVTLCGFADDRPQAYQMLNFYAPDVALFIIPGKQIGPIVTYRKAEERRLPAMGLEFDYGAPGMEWGDPEVASGGTTYMWMTAATSTLFLPLATEQDAAIQFRVIMAMAPDILQSLTLRVNDQPIALTSTADSGGGTIFRGTISRAVLAADARYTRLAFQVNRTLVPADTLPDSHDPRTLGVAFDWLRVAPVSP